MKYVTLKNKFETEVTLCNIGASIYDIKILDKNGKLGSILVHSSLNEFPTSDSYFGKTIGRTGGRIEGSTFEINGVSYKINSNDPNGLHGGVDSLAMKEFKISESEEDDFYEVLFSYISPDMESGYPGNLYLEVTYRLFKNENKMTLCYYAKTDKDTLINLSNHAYFNLEAESGNTILDHTLFVDSDKMEKIENLIPKEIVDCKEIYSFKNPHKVGKYVNEKEIIDNTNGYDYPYILNNPGIGNDSVVLTNDSGRKLTISTTYPVVVIYTCNYCEDVIVNCNKKLFKHAGICFEPMYHPNTYKSSFLKNKNDLLKKDDFYEELIEYKFN